MAPAETPVELRPGVSSRAAQAAARVAARYSQAPSYSEMQAAEARVAVRAAEIATQVALEAQATAEAALAHLEAASSAPLREPELLRPRPVEPIREPVWEIDAAPQVEALRPFNAEPAILQALPAASEESASFGLRWEPDLPSRRTEMSETRAVLGTQSFEIPVEDWWSPGELEVTSAPAIEEVEPAQPIAANLIEFPRELVATRKVRPRRVEGEFAEAAGIEGQLSIYEVDPAAVSMAPEAAPVAKETAAKWPGMQLEESPLPEEALEANPAKYVAPLQVASMNRRLMATVVDGALITALFLGVVLAAGSHVNELPGLKAVELGAALAWSAIALLYQIFFFAVAESTPGMKYSGISLCTFDDQFPSRTRAFARLGALLLSLLPLGLGVAWALFDEEHLSWHDRVSRTYQRKC